MESDKWFTCFFFPPLFPLWLVPLIQPSFLPPVWFLFVALIIHFPHDVPLFSAERDKARRHCRPKLCCSAGNTAALLTVPPAFPPEIISEHAWQKQLAALKHVPSKSSRPQRRATTTTLSHLGPDLHSTRSPCLLRALTRLISSSQTTPEMVELQCSPPGHK